MYELLGICLFLAALILVNACASVTAAVVWRLGRPRVKSFSADARADLLFMLRVAAPVLATIAVAIFVIPSYLSYEPRITSETVSKKLAFLAILSAASVAFALWRTIRSWRATAALRNEWLASSQQIQLPGINIPTFRIAHSFPLIGIVGTLRPQLFIADDVLKALSPDELVAAIAHECGHLVARDNLKRTLLQICRDTLFVIPLGRGVDRMWVETAESAADEFAARQSPAMALNLASALVRIAKMVPVGKRAEVPLGAYLVGADETQGVKSRIKRLLEISSNRSIVGESNWLVRMLPPIALLGLLLTSAVAASNAKVLLTVHTIVERAVSLLS
jgi:Zn-dependent protease with chaperone function